MSDFEFSDPINEIAAALAKGKSAAGTAKKNSTNPHLKNKYADLGEVDAVYRDAYLPQGIVVTQWPLSGGGEKEVRLCTLVMHHASGQWIKAIAALPAVKSDPQAYGSAITYARRYALAAALGIIADEDDDGNRASRQPAPEQPKSEPRPVDLAALERDIKSMSEAKSLAELDAMAKKVATSWPSHRNAVTVAYTKCRDGLRGAA